jgi:hypothetical protein
MEEWGLTEEWAELVDPVELVAWDWVVLVDSVAWVQQQGSDLPEQIVLVLR